MHCVYMLCSVLGDQNGLNQLSEDKLHFRKKFFLFVEMSVREFFQNSKNCKNKWKYYNKVLFINRNSWKERNWSML